MFFFSSNFITWIFAQNAIICAFLVVVCMSTCFNKQVKKETSALVTDDRTELLLLFDSIALLWIDINLFSSTASSFDDTESMLLFQLELAPPTHWHAAPVIVLTCTGQKKHMTNTETEQTMAKKFWKNTEKAIEGVITIFSRINMHIEWQTKFNMFTALHIVSCIVSSLRRFD